MKALEKEFEMENVNKRGGTLNREKFKEGLEKG